jgi:hypothetical protein
MRALAASAIPALWLRRGAAHQRALQEVAALPLYQIALWPDGWERTGDGGVIVRDTHEIAEARRWYAMAARHGAAPRGSASSPAIKTMQLHGLGVPRSLIDLAGRRFASEQAASVAVRLVASEWLEQRRRMLAANPQRLLALRALTWSGSHHRPLQHRAAVERLVDELLERCIDEGLIPSTRFQVEARAQDGYGLDGWCCRVQSDLRQDRRAAVTDALRIALIPWNRQVVRDGKPWTLLSVLVVGRGR